MILRNVVQYAETIIIIMLHTNLDLTNSDLAPKNFEETTNQATLIKKTQKWKHRKCVLNERNSASLRILVYTCIQNIKHTHSW